MGLLTLQDISQTYGHHHLFDGVSLVIGDQERIGILGPNGAGKSTLLRIVAGTEVPDDGQRTTRRGLRIGHLTQEPRLDPTHSIRQAIVAGFVGRAEVLARLDAVHERLGTAEADQYEPLLAEQAKLETELDRVGGHAVDHEVEALVHKLGLDQLPAESVCGDLSGGEQRRVALAQVLLTPADLLILDEPTNHLDAEVIAWLEEKLLNLRCALCLVSHDRYVLDRLVTRTIEIENGALHEYEGGYSEFVAARAARVTHEQAAESTRLNLLRRETEWMRRGPPARTTKAKSRIDRFHDLVAKAPEASSRDLAFEIPPGPRLGERVLEFEGVSFDYGDQPILAGLDIEIGARTRLGIVGPNGAGKSTFLKLCLGQLQPTQGRVRCGSTVEFATIDQSRSDLDATKTVLEEVSGGNDFVHVDGRSIRIESFLDRFLFPGKMKQAKVATLSGGERNRVLLAKLLSAGGNVLILDEPTNDLDLMTLRVLEEALIAFPGVVLVVSHDRYFLDRIATRILHFDGHGHTRVHEGDLSLLLDKLAAERASAENTRKAAAKPSTNSHAPKARRARKLSSRELKELERLPDQIAAAEAELEQLENRFADPELWQNGGNDAKDIGERRRSAQERVAELFARWEELEAIHEDARR